MLASSTHHLIQIDQLLVSSGLGTNRGYPAAEERHVGARSSGRVGSARAQRQEGTLGWVRDESPPARRPRPNSLALARLDADKLCGVSVTGREVEIKWHISLSSTLVSLLRRLFLVSSVIGQSCHGELTYFSHKKE